MMEHMDPEADAYAPGFQMITNQELNAEAETARAFKRVFWAMLLAAFVLLTFHSGALVTYVRGLPIGPVEDTIIAVTEAWHEQMDRNGVTALMEEMRAGVAAVHDATWADVDDLVSGRTRPGPPPEDLRGGVNE